MIRHRGNFKKTERFFKRMQSSNYLNILEKYGRKGVELLKQNTPLDTGETASMWGYEIKRTNRGATIVWTNNHIEDGVPIAILLQYGHGTGTGGFVQGRDYINPALKPIFDKFVDEIWKEVRRV